MRESILSRLEASRKELLDLGLRNPLLNYKPLSARGLSMVDEKASAVYDILVKQGKAMAFIARTEKKENGISAVVKSGDAVLESSHTDSKLQTAETENLLQHKLLNTYYAAHTSMEEQGANILYIALGLLEWYESGSSEEPRRAPLVLIPVALDRSSARERFRVRYTLEEIEANISLQAKMRAEFGIVIPDLPDEEELEVELYFDAVEKEISLFQKWKVDRDKIELGFFSFGKFMIYHDLDNGKWPEDKKPVDHPTLTQLFGNGFNDTAPGFTEDDFIDTDTNAHALFQVVDADSSQVLAMLAVNEGKNLVIQGPPGTGKSQTITNIIANAVGQGKKVLFVAEKMAALEVVKRRLDNINLGEACLELHSHKANKKELHEELRRVLELGKPAIYKLQQEVALLDQHKNELNDYCLAINAQIKESGLTAQQVMGFLINLSEVIGPGLLPKLLIPGKEEWTATDMIRAEALAEKIEARVKDIGVPSELLFWGSNLTVLLPQQQEELKNHLLSAELSVTELEQTVNTIAEYLGVSNPLNREESLHLTSILLLASEQPDTKEMTVDSENWLLYEAGIKEFLEAGERLSVLHDEYKDVFMPEAWEANLLEIRQDLLAHGDKWYRVLIGDYKRSNKKLASLCKEVLPKDNHTKLRYVNDLIEGKRLEKIVSGHKEAAKALFKRRYQELKTDWPVLHAATVYITKVQQLINEAKCPKEIIGFLLRNESIIKTQQYHQQLLDSLSKHGKAIGLLMEALQFDEALRFGGKTLQHQSFIQQKNSLKEWSNRLPEIQQVIAWNNLRQVAREENLQALTDAAISWPHASTHLKPAIQKTWYEYLLQVAVNSFPALRKFERTSHEETINGFKKLDALNLHFNRARVALKHWESMPRLEAGGQVNILRTEFNKKARHMPIRKLMLEAGLAIQAIKPVFMMSPLSIANFLPPGSVEFDLVVFDEASQVRPVEALGALLRAKQLVVVGDAKQLPPTSFFDSLTKEIDDDENVTADLESILGMCDGQGAPQRMLRWHYRSRHESLISLSNYEFYENRLVVFPSPGSKHHLGLVYHHLKNTTYDRGKSRTNFKEAEAVVDAVLAHARKHPKLSLGVVAFSTAQRQTIQDVLEEKRREHPDLETFFRSHTEEPFFVKNLENVQGDERDVIFISIGYGRTEEGYVSMSFGPLNNEGGEKRLNVLITRAKLRCEVFTNLTADDLDTNRTKSVGVHALKSFLYFAEHGALGLPEHSLKPSESPFEDMVAHKLRSLGYTVREQIGSQGFYIDLAVVDPENPGRYLLGIECDGAAYHAARSARDRDRLRQQILEGIGWRIYRVWSTDWFRNPDRELKRLAEAVEKAKQVLYSDDLPEEEEEELLLHRENREEAAGSLPYQVAQLPAEIAKQEMHLHTVGKLAGWLEEVVRIESPVHFEEVARRMVEAAGVSRVGPRIREHLKLAAKFAEGSKRVKIKGDFLWHVSKEKPEIRNRSAFQNASRKFKYIASEEISLAVEKIVRHSVAISPEAAVPFIAKMFGFARVTEEMKNDLLAVIEETVEKDLVRKEGELLKVS